MIINAHTITSPNTKIPAAPTTEMISVLTTINISNMINKIMNKHIYISSFFSLKEMHITRIHMLLLSKQVSHRSRGIGLSFKAHIIWRIGTVGYSPFTHFHERLLKNSINFGCNYIMSVSHGSISFQYVDFVLLLNLCCITASPLTFTWYNVHESYTRWSQI